MPGFTLLRMTARVFWALYLVLAFGIAPAIFRLRFGRWPFAYPLRRADSYLWIDFAYGAATIAFTACLFLAEPVEGWSPIAGLVLGVLAVLLGGWAIIAIGPSWRIGQDRAEIGIARVMSGPYRHVRHPIYVGLILLSIAMLLMAGPAPCTITFACATAVYALIQGWNENRRWRV
jgi:protein-S-isoprenylcysteine O-methyltransferase Ste14